ncbi:unnamed protein product [Blepharisma stoltei]|uniref:RING-type domain-containing protein n=1 Tax=Blepharisma stoltei TaxID=1481888 RepID=A0AAU9IQT0_9CILI|nr:unnamed protein product [Blepharisma stoltei]
MNRSDLSSPLLSSQHDVSKIDRNFKNIKYKTFPRYKLISLVLTIFATKTIFSFMFSMGLNILSMMISSNNHLIITIALVYGVVSYFITILVILNFKTKNPKLSSSFVTIALLAVSEGVLLSGLSLFFSPEIAVIHYSFQVFAFYWLSTIVYISGSFSLMKSLIVVLCISIGKSLLLVFYLHQTVWEIAICCGILAYESLMVLLLSKVTSNPRQSSSVQKVLSVPIMMYKEVFLFSIKILSCFALGLRKQELVDADIKDFHQEEDDFCRENIIENCKNEDAGHRERSNSHWFEDCLQPSSLEQSIAFSIKDRKQAFLDSENTREPSLEEEISFLKNSEEKLKQELNKKIEYLNQLQKSNEEIRAQLDILKAENKELARKSGKSHKKKVRIEQLKADIAMIEENYMEQLNLLNETIIAQSEEIKKLKHRINDQKEAMEEQFRRDFEVIIKERDLLINEINDLKHENADRELMLKRHIKKEEKKLSFIQNSQYEAIIDDLREKYRVLEEQLASITRERDEIRVRERTYSEPQFLYNEEKELCIYCMNQKKNTLFLPCGHSSYCHSCVIYMGLPMDKEREDGYPLIDCPCCRQKVKIIHRVFIY